MGIYSHLTELELLAKRDQLLAALESAASGVASASGEGRSVAYQRSFADTRRLLDAVNAALARRQGRPPSHRPIYLT